MAYGEKSTDQLLANLNERHANRVPKSPEDIESQREKAARVAAHIAVGQAEQAQRDRGEVVARDVENDKAWEEWEHRDAMARAQEAYENGTEYVD